MAGFMDISGTNLILKSSTVNENILCSNNYTTILTKCQANDGITIKKTIAYSPGMIGYTYNIATNSTSTTIASSSTIYNITTSTTTIPRGVYIINIKIGLNAPTSGTNINFLSSGLSTQNSAYAIGTGVFTMLPVSLVTTATSQTIYGMDCRPCDLSGNPYYLVVNANTDTNNTTTIPSYCACSCTRIA